MCHKYNSSLPFTQMIYLKSWCLWCIIMLDHRHVFILRHELFQPLIYTTQTFHLIFIREVTFHEVVGHLSTIGFPLENKWKILNSIKHHFIFVFQLHTRRQTESIYEKYLNLSVAVSYKFLEALRNLAIFKHCSDLERK